MDAEYLCGVWTLQYYWYVFLLQQYLRNPLSSLPRTPDTNGPPPPERKRHAHKLALDGE